MKYNNFRKIASETVDILNKQSYINNQGKLINIAKSLSESIERSLLWTPEELDELICNQKNKCTGTIDVEIRNETCLNGARRLVADQYGPVCLLNFASATYPGGGFLSGAQAQEESIARASGLYSSLLKFPQYYNYHKNKDFLYSDHIIFTPECPVFRDDEGNWLDEPYYIDIITCAAPNVNGINMENGYSFEGEDIARTIINTINKRAEKILALAHWSECKSLILGAWGCGAFGCPPEIVAKTWRKLIGKYGPNFILMDVYDDYPGHPIYNVFKREFGQ